MERYVGGHPVAGRERGGPHWARAELFVGHPWVLTPGPSSADDAVGDVRRLVEACGARPLLMTPEAHDRALAVTSHLPQLLASALGAQIGTLAASEAAVAGPGLRDMIRIARSDPTLWEEVAAGNAEPIAEALAATARRLSLVARELRTLGGPSSWKKDEYARSVRRLLEDGALGHALLPGKHGARPRGFASVAVLVPDRPGQLARLFADVEAAAINVEDLHLEHEPGTATGVLDLGVRPERVDQLTGALRERGWQLVGEVRVEADPDRES